MLVITTNEFSALSKILVTPITMSIPKTYQGIELIKELSFSIDKIPFK
jgi:hypothetical protein